MPSLREGSSPYRRLKVEPSNAWLLTHLAFETRRPKC